MKTTNIIREFFGIRYRHASFGARPDLTHPELVNHPLAEGQYIVQETETMTDAYIAAHAEMGKKIANGFKMGCPAVSGSVEIFRAVEHEPVTLPVCDSDPNGELFGMRTVTMTITATDEIPAIPHFSSSPLSNYHPVNGRITPKTIDA